MTILKNNHKSGINENNIKVATVTEEQQVQSRALTPGTLPLPIDSPIRAGAQVYQVSATGVISYPDHPECSSQRNIFCKVTVTANKKFKSISKALLKIEKYGGDTNGEFAVWEASENQMLQTVYCSNYLKTVTMQNDKTYAVIDITEHVKSGESKVFYLAITSEDGSMLCLNKTGMVEVSFVEDDDLIPSGKLEKQVGAKGGYAINARNGKLQYNQQIFASKGGLMPFGLSLSYNATNCDSSSPNGIANGMKGWTFNYQQSLMTGLGKMFYVDASNVVHTFRNPTNNSNVWFDATGKSGMVLVATDTGYTMSDGKTATLKFDTSKRLVSVEQKLSSSKTIATAIEYASDGKISKVTDGLGDVYILAWEHEDGYNGVRISKVLNETTETLLAEISLTDERVMQVKYCLSGDVVDFAYDENGQLISVLDSASQQRAAFEYNTVGGISAVKNYIRNVDDEDQVADVATDSNHFEYKLLQTRIASCRNSDYKYNAYSTMAYLFAEDGELLTTTEVKGVTLQPLRYRTKLDFEKSSGSIPDKVVGQARFDGQEIVETTTDATSLPFTVTNPGQFARTFVFSAAACISANDNVSNDGSQKLTVQIWENNQKIASAEFDPSKRETESVCGTFMLSGGTHQLTAKLVLTNLRAHVSFGNVKVYSTNTGAQKQCINVDTNFSDVVEFDGSTNRWWNEQDYCSLQYNGGTITNVIFNAKDYALTLISRLQNPTAYNVWYNDGKDMLYQVSNVNLISDGVSYPIADIKICTMATSMGKTVFEYIEPTSTHLYKARKVTTVTIDGNHQGVVAEEFVNANFQTAKAVDEHGISTEYTYDTNGSVTKVVTKAPAGSTMNIKENFTYNDKNLRASSVERRYLDDYTQSFVYGTDYELTKDTQPNGLVTEFAYSAGKDKLASIFAEVDEATSQNDISYDGDLIDTLSDTRTAVDFAYDKRHNISQVKIGNKVVLEKEITYNADGSTQSVTTYGNGQKIKKYYDRYDRLVRVSDSTGLQVELVDYIYNDTEIDKGTFDLATFYPTVSANSPLRAVVDHVAETITWYTYDEFGRIYDTSSSALTTHQRYDQYGRVALCETATDQTDIYVVNTVSHVGPVDDTIASETVEYVSEFTQGDELTKLTTTYTRDGLERPTETKVMQGNYGYKQALDYIPRQEKVWIPTGGQIIKSVPATPNVAPIIPLPPISGYWQTTDMGTTQYVSKFKEYSMSGTTATLVRTDLVEYDANGNITKYGNVTYEYDKLGRLVRENNPTTGVDKTVTWCYDISGNILSRTEYAYTAGDLAGVTPTNTFTYTYDTDWKDQLVEVTKNGDTHHTFSYDQAGNPTTYRGKTLTWTRGRLLASYGVTGSNYITTMQYDASGIRREKLVPSVYGSTTTTFFYNGNNLVREKIVNKVSVQSHTHYKTYLYNSQGVIGFVQGSNTYTYRKNLFGDIVALYQGATKVAEYAYDAWGNCTVIDPATGYVSTSDVFIGNQNPFRYRGYYWDNDLGLYYLMSRYYDPQTGRFINADSLEYLDSETIGGLNLYAYCGNNPVMGVDPSGHVTVDFFLDLFFIGWDIYNLATNEGWKDWKNWVALGVDILFAVVPFVTGGGGQIVKLANVADDIADFKKVTVVGETMSRVQTVSQFVNATDNLYDGFKAYNKLSSQGKLGKAIAEIGGKLDNLSWLYRKLRKGYTVIDIGIDVLKVSEKTGRLVRSSSYLFERILLKVWKYRNIWKWLYHIF